MSVVIDSISGRILQGVCCHFVYLEISHCILGFFVHALYSSFRWVLLHCLGLGWKFNCYD